MSKNQPAAQAVQHLFACAPSDAIKNLIRAMACTPVMVQLRYHESDQVLISLIASPCTLSLEGLDAVNGFEPLGRPLINLTLHDWMKSGGNNLTKLKKLLNDRVSTSILAGVKPKRKAILVEAREVLLPICAEDWTPAPALENVLKESVRQCDQNGLRFFELLGV